MLSVLSQPTFERFEDPKPRMQIGTAINLEAGEVSHDQTQLGYEVALRDGSEIVFLEGRKFVFVQRAP